jgi:hypothetical protein
MMGSPLHTLLAVANLFVSGACLATAYQIEDRLHSEFGEIQLVRHPYDDGSYGPPETILLNGKTIFKAPEVEPYLTLHGIYRLADGQAILVSQNCGGSGCRISPLSFILLAKHAKPRVLTRGDFNSETNQIIATEKSGKIVVDLGYYRDKQKIAVLDSGNLSITLTDSSIRELPDAQCKYLFGAVDVCTRDYNSSGRCVDYSTTDFGTGGYYGSNADVWTVRYASHFPGFNRNGFIESCMSACKTGTVESYEAFRSRACTLPPR